MYKLLCTGTGTGIAETAEKSGSGRLQTITANVVQMDRTIDQVSTDLERIDRTLGELSSFNKRFMSTIEALPDAKDAAADEAGQGAALTSILASVQQIHDLQQRQSTLLRAGLPALAPGASGSVSGPGSGAGAETNIDDAASSVTGGRVTPAKRAGSRDQLNDAPSRQVPPAAGAFVPGRAAVPGPAPAPTAKPRHRRSQSPSLSDDDKITISSDSEDENARVSTGLRFVTMIFK